ncbi:MAG: hypothetical protein JWQ72_2025 [Polaromonas sp.]|nr:hypothetical protein [Polaromonas sp.]
MDGPTIQARVYKGYARAATVIGLAYAQYRPTSATAPITTPLAMIKAAFDSKANYSFSAPNEYGDATWYALLDDASVANGDYLIGNGQVYFVAAKQFLLPVLAIDCNRSVAVLRQAAPASPVGAQPYGGTVFSEDVAALGTLNSDGTLNAGWPASILLAGRAGKAIELPMAVNGAGWRILLPPSVPIVIGEADVLLDDLGRRYTVEAAELTDLGWRINAKEAHP